MGKGWSKGLTSATDGRVARAAAAHRGLQYRRLRASPPIEWSPRLAYAVGLIATDGCLSGDGRHIAFVSMDEDLMRTLLSLVGKAHTRYRRFESEFGGWAFRGQFSYAALYRWLLTVGLMPRKSLVLGGIDVADDHLMPLVRGLLDGDGTVYTLVHHPTRKTYPEYRYERLWAYFNSGSRKHVEWVRARLGCALGIAGYIEELKQESHENPIYRLKYGNRASRVLLHALYADESVPRLRRKWLKWNDYLLRHPLCGRRDLNPHDLTATRP
jgi:hypothetical protein